jgi:hypothetical protein
VLQLPWRQDTSFVRGAWLQVGSELVAIRRRKSQRLTNETSRQPERISIGASIALKNYNATVTIHPDPSF